MKIVTLMENTACREGLACEHGLSLYIGTGEHRILFDAGQTEAFADNAQKLGIDLSRVELAVLSHGHYDHGGGLKRFLEINAEAPVFLHREAFGAHFNGTQKDIGLDPALRHCGRLVFAEDVLELVPGIRLHSCNDRPYTMDSFGLTRREGDAFVPDRFRHEQYLLIEEAGMRSCFSGCSHKGILNIVNWFRPDVLVGGFHFMKLDPAGEGAEALSSAARKLLEYPTTYNTGHCTGQAQFDFMKSIMGSRLHAISAGTVIRL